MDVGTAWTGPHPYSDENYFNTQVIPGNPISITLLNNREPFIMGFGTGIRAMLFGYFMKLDCGWGLDSGVVRSTPFAVFLGVGYLGGFPLKTLRHESIHGT
jgi:hypothetical protein